MSSTARIMRYFAGQGMVTETQENMFTASNITQAFVPPGLKAGMVHKYFVTSFYHQLY